MGVRSKGIGTPTKGLEAVSLRQYKLVYCILARKRQFLVYFQSLAHKNLRVLSETGLWMREAVGKSGDALSENFN